MRVAIEEVSRVEIITKEAKIDDLMKGFGEVGITGMTVYQTKGCGVQLGTQEYEMDKSLVQKLANMHHKQAIQKVKDSNDELIEAYEEIFGETE